MCTNGNVGVFVVIVCSVNISNGHIHKKNTAILEGLYKNIYSFTDYSEQWQKNINILLGSKDTQKLIIDIYSLLFKRTV